MLTIGNDGDGGDSDTEKGNNLTPPKPLINTFTNAENKITKKQCEQDQQLQSMSSWRHSKTNLNSLQSLNIPETGRGDYAAPTNAASFRHRFRAQNAFNKFVHQSIDFARRR